MITKIEVENVGIFKIKYDRMHRGINPRLITHKTDRFKAFQFDHYDEGLLDSIYQKGYDYEGNEVRIRILERS